MTGRTVAREPAPAQNLARGTVMRPTVDAVAPGAYRRLGGQPRRPVPAWVICALLFFITTINYMDRQIIGVLKPVLAQDLHWSEIDYGNIVFFSSSSPTPPAMSGWAGSMTWSGPFGLTVAVIIWSLARRSRLGALGVRLRARPLPVRHRDKIAKSNEHFNFSIITRNLII